MIYLINPLTLLLVFIIYAHTSGIALKIVTIIGGIIDITVNLTWFTVIFLDVPRELMLTKRIERLKSTSGYRGKLAMLLCKLLNLIKQGHCI